jgi:transposase InsO family protein
MKKRIVDAIAEAKRAGVTIERSCEIIMLPKSRYYAWLSGRKPDEVTGADLADKKSTPGSTPQKITPSEREAIVEIAKDDDYADLSHRKLAYTALDEGRVSASPSTFYRVMKGEELVGRDKRSRPRNLKKPEVETNRPNQVWQFDVTYLRLITGIFVYIVFILDRFSRKIVGARASYSRKSDDIIATWDQALESEGLLESDDKPLAFSDNGPEMKSKPTMGYFNEIGITQDHSRPHTPNDNAHAEAVIATAKCEYLYMSEFANIYEVQDALDDLIDHYNNVRLHQGIGYVTPQVKHMGLEEVVFEARRRSLARAREERIEYNKAVKSKEPDGERSACQQEETLTLTEPILSGRL